MTRCIEWPWTDVTEIDLPTILSSDLTLEGGISYVPVVHLVWRPVDLSSDTSSPTLSSTPTSTILPTASSNATDTSAPAGLQHSALQGIIAASVIVGVLGIVAMTCWFARYYRRKRHAKFRDRGNTAANILDHPSQPELGATNLPPTGNRVYEAMAQEKSPPTGPSSGQTGWQYQQQTDPRAGGLGSRSHNIVELASTSWSPHAPVDVQAASGAYGRKNTDNSRVSDQTWSSGGPAVSPSLISPSSPSPRFEDYR